MPKQACPEQLTIRELMCDSSITYLDSDLVDLDGVQQAGLIVAVHLKRHNSAYSA